MDVLSRVESEEEVSANPAAAAASASGINPVSRATAFISLKGYLQVLQNNLMNHFYVVKPSIHSTYYPFSSLYGSRLH